MHEFATGRIWTGALFAFAVLWVCCRAEARAEAAGTGRPNIVFILADDWGWGDLGCHGHPYLKTPNLDRLAAEGTDFRQFTVASSVCSPSRAAILTGQFPARHSVHGHFATVESHERRGMPDWLNPDVVLLPRLLQEAGYATAHFGKWHLTNIMVTDAPLPLQYGFHEYGAYNCSGPQMPVHEDVKRAIAFLERSVAAGKPFFLNLWIHEPHTPHYPKPDHLEKFAHLEREADRIYAAVLAHADARIGNLLAALDRLEVREDTLVIFTSDNGPERTGSPERRIFQDESTGPGFGTFASVGTTGGHRGRKRSLLQGGIGVPFLVRWPGKLAADAVDDTTPLSAVDLLPTFCELADVDLPEDYAADGVSQVDAFLGEAAAERTPPIFWEWKYARNRKGLWPAQAVRDGAWKLLLSRDGTRSELFRFPEDRLETKDVSASRPEVVQRLRASLREWQEALPEKPDPSCFSELRGG